MVNIVHIGLPKTATSTLQRYVFPILHKNKIVNFNDKDLFYFTRKHLALGLDESEKYIFLERLEEGDNLISDESIVGKDPHEWENRAEKLFNLYGEDTNIVISARESRSLFTSLYVQALQENNIVEPQDYFVSTEEYKNISKIVGYPHLYRILDVDAFNLESLYTYYAKRFKKVYLVDIRNLDSFEFFRENLDIEEEIYRQLREELNTVNDNLSYSKLAVKWTLRRERILKGLYLQSFSSTNSISPREQLSFYADREFSLEIPQHFVFKILRKLLLLHWRRFAQGIINKYFKYEKYTLPEDVYLNEEIISRNNIYISNGGH